MAQSKITLIGIENYLNPDRSVFDNMVLPKGIDKDVLIGSIILRCQEFELLYSDPDFLTSAVNVWSRKNYRTFDKWVKALEIKYDPLFNYDRTEEYTDTHKGSKNGSGSNTRTDNLTKINDLTRTDNLLSTDDHTQTNNLTNTQDVTRTDNLASTNDLTLTHSEKAYNSSGYVGTTQDVTDQDGSQTGTVRNAGTVTDTGTVRNAGTIADTGTVKDTGTIKDTGTVKDDYTNKDDDNYTNTHKARLFGNIGVTTSQQMLQSELDIAKWNLYEHIADLFCNEFCIMVY